MKFLASLMLLLCCGWAMADDLKYEGTWVTVKNRKLNGDMTCVVTENGKDKWKGHFYGTWEGRKFSYNVDFTGPPDKLVGKAVIDGADYDWTGEIGAQSPGWFKGSFTGNRYTGSFDLKQKTKN